MPLDLLFGEKVYQWYGRRQRAYRVIRWVSCLGRERFFKREILKALGLAPGATVLDLACGNGFNLVSLTTAIGPEGRVIAIDYSAEMLAAARVRAKTHGWRQVEFVQCDATRVELQQGQCDAALCTFGLSAMPNETAAVRNVVRALRPGAPFVVFDAKPFTGWARGINPFHQPLFRYATNWDHDKDVIGRLRREFEIVDVAEFHSGCNYIAICRKASGTYNRA